MNLVTSLIAANYHAGRTHPIDMIVIHVTEGSADSVIEFFHTPRPAEPTSAHYMVQKDGTVVQFVKEEDTAYHAGRVDGATASLVLDRPGTNPNGYSIGIEHEGDGAHEMTTDQHIASLELIHDIAARRSIPLDRQHIVGHHEIFAPKTCPGAINVDVLVSDLGA
jgi:N-acetyl-anhydromuramyl-L-alanine amidase AmpD